MADKTILDGGVVYGAAWDENMQLMHIGIEDAGKLDALRRSKYVQSDTDGVYKDVRSQLKTGRKVLFCGTPCQVAGLLSFLGNKEYPNLITAGVVCHGVPSQKSFDNYLHEIEEEKKINDSGVLFQIWSNKESLIKCSSNGLKDIKKVKGLPLNGKRIINGQSYYTKSVIYNGYSLSLTLKQEEPFDIKIENINSLEEQ